MSPSPRPMHKQARALTSPPTPCFRPVLPAVALFCSLALAAHAADPQPNLVRNPSFEKSAENSPLPADWRADATIYRRIESSARDGAAALAYTNDDPERYRLATQTIPLQPGRRYQLTGWVRTENLVGKESGATFCIEWSDKQGKWLGGSYPSGVKGTRGWTKITGIVQVPEAAGRCTLSCYVRRGMTGRAWFDDVQVVRVFEPPLRTVLTSPVYRGRITQAGPATLRAVARIDSRDCEIPPEQLRVRATVFGSGTQVLSSRDCKPQYSDGRFEPLKVELPVGALTPGQYRLEIALLDGDGKPLQQNSHDVTRLADDFRPACTIDEHCRLLVDGKPFFPLGMYFSSIKQEDLEVYADSKFNCLMPYGSPKPDQMDLAHQYGLKIIYSIKNWYAGSRWCPSSIKTPDDEEPMVRRRVREFRDHPALLAWYLNDELSLTFLPQLQAHQRWVSEEDPNHPTWVVLYQVNQVASYIDTFDAIGTDPYPIGRKPASMAADWTAKTRRGVEGARPMWQVPQLHNWANYQKHASGSSQPRTPTFDEVRSMAWQCIAEGATGLVFYSWYDVQRNPDVGFEEQWAGLKRLAVEIDRMAPVILSVEPAPAITVGGTCPPTWLHWLVRQQNGKTYLLAVNDGDGQGEVTVELPADPLEIRELGDDRVLQPGTRSFTAHFAPLEVHLYEIRLK